MSAGTPRRTAALLLAAAVPAAAGVVAALVAAAPAAAQQPGAERGQERQQDRGQPPPRAAARAAVRVLLFGDRSLDSHFDRAVGALAGVGEVVRSPLGHLSSGAALERIDEVLGEERWDVVCFNFGLSDLMTCDPRTRAVRAMSPAAGGVPVTPLERYDDHLEAFAARVRAAGAQPLFVTTLPLSPRRRSSAVAAQDIASYNRVAVETCARLDVPVLDAGGLLVERIEQEVAGKRGRPEALRDRAHIQLLRSDLSRPVVEAVRALLEAEGEAEAPAEADGRGGGAEGRGTEGRGTGSLGA